jgi:hypothetical protein
MAKYQLPPLKDEKIFEEFICDLFNVIENTNTYNNTDFQTFGVKGQNQKGIDVFSAQTKTVIQCKLKDVRKKDDVLRKNLIEDITIDIEKVKDLKIEFERYILVSTFRDDTKLQEFVNEIRNEQNLSFYLYYWGWDTISKHAEQSEIILKKYFPEFKPKTIKPKIELPEGALGKDLSKKNYINYLIKRYGDWKQIELNRKNEKFNWASFNKHIMNEFKATGINFIEVRYFEKLVEYLHSRIDKTTFGRNRKSKNMKNYSAFEEFINGVLID